MLEPGATIGILGSGQLGRMLALAAARLGFKCHIFAPDRDSPAFDVVRHATFADYTDEQALARFAQSVDVVTYEFENIPADAATFLAARVPVLPDPKVLATTQDRLAEKDFVAGLGIGTAPYAAVATPAELCAALERIGRPAVLKTRRFGYDGKGQATINGGTAPEAAWRDVGEQPCILEAFVPFAREVSVVAARGRDGVRRMFRRDRKRAPRPYSENLPRAGRRVRRRRTRSAPHRRDDRGKVRLCRRAGGGDVRARRRRPSGQRDRAAGAQFRPLDARRRLGVAIRAAHPGGRRLAARQSPSATAAWK